MSGSAALGLGVVVGAMATALIGGIAWAAIPADNGGVPACYNTGDGSVRVRVDPSKSCSKGWAALDLVSQVRTYTRQGVFTIEPGSIFRSFEINCAEGDVAVGGGFRAVGANVNVEGTTATNDQPATGWQAAFRMRSVSDNPTNVGVDVVCLDR